MSDSALTSLSSFPLYDAKGTGAQGFERLALPYFLVPTRVVGRFYITFLAVMCVFSSSYGMYTQFRLRDTVRTSNDTIVRVDRASSSGIDTVVSYKAKDSVIFVLAKKKMRLRGEASTSFRTRALQSEAIEILFDNGLMTSSGVRDSNGVLRGSPVLRDNGSTYAGEEIKYNFKTQSGTVSLGETTIENGFFTGSRIKRNPDQSMFVERGCYTTCDKPHPHFYFTSEKMKLLPDDKVFMSDFYLYVHDIPILYLPIGVFFPNSSKGRQSGLLIPRPFVDANRGVSFQNFGYYFALSEYYDTQITADFYSKGGWQLNNKWNYNVRYLLDGRLDMSYAYVRPNPQTDYKREYAFAWNHNQTFSPQTRLNANINLQSSTFNQSTITTLAQRIRQNVFSSAGLSHTFDNNIGVSLNYVRNQDLQSKTYDQSPSLSLNVPALFPFKRPGNDSWTSDIAFNYSSSLSSTFLHSLGVSSRDTVVFDSVTNTQVRKTLYDSTYDDSYRALWRHSPSISISPKLGVVSVTPSVNFAANMYPRRITRTYDTSSRSIRDSEETGLFTEYSASFGVQTRTTLYGSPLNLGNVALRHTMMPSLGVSYTPGLGDERFGFYSAYTVPADSLHKQSRTIQYSRFERDGGGIASRNQALLLTWSLDNAFDAKVSRDSADEKLELARLNVSGNVDFMKDSNAISDIRWNLRTPSVGATSMYANFSTTVYDDVQIRDTAGNLTNRRSRVASLLLDEGRFPLRLTAFEFNLNTSFGSRDQSATAPLDMQDTVRPGLGERFSQRIDYQESVDDVFGESTPGSSRLLFPWNVSMNLTYSYSKPFSTLEATQNLNVQSTISLSLTPTLSITGGLNVDLLQKTVNAPAISIRKVIHCWALDITWYPTGSVRGFYLSFSPISSVLRDLRFERRSSSYIR